jgi:aminomethyltransferase
VITTNQVGALEVDQIQYSLMTAEDGGVIDDVLVYRDPFGYKLVCNAANREAVLAQCEAHRPSGDVTFVDRTLDSAMFALQGPRSLEILQPLLNFTIDGLGYYHAAMGRITGVDCVVSRTGYTGEDGFEIMVGHAKATPVWEALLERGASFGLMPCGLGARDTLRLEAGMPLYGHELTREIDPYTAGLGLFVKLDKGEFVGRSALVAKRNALTVKRVGLEIEGKRIAREGAVVSADGREVGKVSSGTFSPTLDRAIAMAFLSKDAAKPGQKLTVDVRGQPAAARVVKLPFYQRPRN